MEEKLKTLCGLSIMGGLLVASTASSQLRTEEFVNDFGHRTVAMVQDPTDPQVQFLVQELGHIRVILNGQLLSQDFLDLSPLITQSGSQRGLLGMAFDPNYVTNRRFYVCYIAIGSNATVVARYKRSASNPLLADPASRFDFRFGANRFIPQPATNVNKGGTLAFGPDGYLYIGLGDGGTFQDALNNAQNPNSYLGKILRIDVNVPDNDPVGFRIPPDNPFLDGDPISALGEIWAFGLQDPWGFSFDSPAAGGTGAMLLPDRGWSSWEEVNYEPLGRGGRNYGWSVREGLHPFRTDRQPAYTPLTDPIFEYPHSEGLNITGGHVYRGTMLGCDYFGRYFFGDETGKLFSVALSIDPETGEATASDFVDHTGDVGTLGTVKAIEEDANGELYIVDYSGIVRRLLPENAVWATNVTAVDGGIISGGLRELLCLDGLKVRTFSSFTSEIDQANLTTLEFDLQTDIQKLTHVDVSVTASINQPVGGQLRVFFKNVNTGQWERVATFNTTTAEQTFTALHVPVANYLNANGRMQMQVRSIVNLPITEATFFTTINQVRVTPG